MGQRRPVEETLFHLEVHSGTDNLPRLRGAADGQTQCLPLAEPPRPHLPQKHPADIISECR